MKLDIKNHKYSSQYLNQNDYSNNNSRPMSQCATRPSTTQTRPNSRVRNKTPLFNPQFSNQKDDNNEQMKFSMNNNRRISLYTNKSDLNGSGINFKESVSNECKNLVRDSIKASINDLKGNTSIQKPKSNLQMKSMKRISQISDNESDISSENIVLEMYPKQSFFRFKKQIQDLKNYKSRNTNEMHDQLGKIRDLYSNIDKYFKDVPNKLNKEKTKQDQIKTLEDIQLETINQEQSIIKKNYENSLNNLFNSEDVKKFMKFDHGYGEYRKTDNQNILNYLVQQFPPVYAKKIIDLFNIPKHKLEIKSLHQTLLEIINWDIHKVFKFCFEIHKQTKTDSLNVKDMAMYQSSCILLKDKRDELLTDVLKLMDQAMVNNQKCLSQNGHAVKNIRRDIKRVLADLDNSMFGNKLAQDFDPNVFLGKVNVRIMQNLNQNAVVPFNVFLFDINWHLDSNGNKTKLFFPNIWNQILQIFTGQSLKDSNQKFKRDEINKLKDQKYINYTQTLEFAQNEYQKLCEQNGIQIIFDSRYNLFFERVKIRFPENSNQYMIIKTSFFRLADRSNYLLNFDLLKFQFEKIIGLKNDLPSILVNILWRRIFAPRSEPVNFQRFIEIIQNWDYDPIKLVQNIFDLSKSDLVTIKDLSKLEEIFAWSPYLKQDVKHMSKQLVDHNREQLVYDNVCEVLKGHSRISNWILLTLQNTDLFKMYGQTNINNLYAISPDQIMGKYLLSKWFPGFVKPPSDDYYNQQY